jgi:hypothetical protein
MRWLLWLVAFLAALYGGYWFAGSSAVLKATEATLAQMKADGNADYSKVELHGFPSRFDVTITDPKLVSQDGLVTWSAPFVQVLALSYRPNNVIAVWPNDQTLTLADETLSLKSSSLKASVTVSPTLSLPLDHSEMEGHDLVLSRSTEADPALVAEKLIFATRLATDQAGDQTANQTGDQTGTNSHQAALVVTNLAPGPALRARIDPGNLLPEHADNAQADVLLDFDRPLDRSATTQPPRLTGLRNIDARFGWGDIRLQATGSLVAGIDGYAEGRLNLVAQNWEKLFAVVKETGLIRPDMEPTIRNVLQAMAQGSGEAGTLKIPLSFTNGTIRLGPIPLGPAPQF